MGDRSESDRGQVAERPSSPEVAPRTDARCVSPRFQIDRLRVRVSGMSSSQAEGLVHEALRVTAARLGNSSDFVANREPTIRAALELSTKARSRTRLAQVEAICRVLEESLIGSMQCGGTADQHQADGGQDA